MSHQRVQKERQKERNLVAKHARQFTLAHTFEDRKRRQKAGKVKHRAQLWEQ